MQEIPCKFISYNEIAHWNFVSAEVKNSIQLSQSTSLFFKGYYITNKSFF